VSSIVNVAAVVVRVVVSPIVRQIVVVCSSVVAAEDGAWPCTSCTDEDGEGDMKSSSYDDNEDRTNDEDAADA
jgi:hypothetical protein